MFELLAINDLE